jgi:hypothetical protein
MKFEIFIAVKIPYFRPLCDFQSWARGWSWFARASSLGRRCRPSLPLTPGLSLSKSSGFPTARYFFLRSSQFAARTRALYNWRPTDVVSLWQFRSRERSRGPACTRLAFVWPTWQRSASSTMASLRARGLLESSALKFDVSGVERRR